MRDRNRNTSCNARDVPIPYTRARALWLALCFGLMLFMRGRPAFAVLKEEERIRGRFWRVTSVVVEGCCFSCRSSVRMRVPYGLRH